MSEDSRTLWVGNLHKDVTDELVYELFLQTGPIEKLIFPTEGDGDQKKHKGHAYVLFKHAESVKFATQVLEGTKLFENGLEMKARSMPITYRSTPPASTPMGNRYNNNLNNRFSDSSSLRGGFNRTHTWHGREDFVPRGRGGGGYRHKGPGSNYNQNNSSSYGQQGQGSYNNYNNQMNASGYWMGGQQQQMGGNTTTTGGYSTDMEAKRQRILQQQNLIIQGTTTQQQQQQQQGMMNMYGQQQQQTWNSAGGAGGTESYSTATTAGGNNTWTSNTNMYQSYGNQQQQQYGNWYSQQ